MVIVSSVHRDIGPARIPAVFCRVESTLESHQLGKFLWTQSDHFTKNPAQVPLAHPHVLGNGCHAEAFEASGCNLREPRVRIEAASRSKPFGDGCLQYDNCRVCVFRGGKLLCQTLRRGGVPQILERDDAAREFRSRFAENCVIRSQWQTDKDGALSTAKQLAFDLALWAQRMNVESTRHMRAESNDQVQARAGNRDSCRLRLALIHDDVKRCIQQAGAGSLGNSDAVRHGAIVGSHQHPGKCVRFLQSRRVRALYTGSMKILITGATGKVGSRLAKRLAGGGHDVRALVRDSSRAAALLTNQIELVEGDLLSPDSLALAVQGMAAVVHCAAFFRGATPEQAHAVNELGTQHLASAARYANVQRLVFLSTGLTYGSNGGRLADEDDACNPVDAYPLSKVAAEKMLLEIEGMDVRILRLPFVYGDGDPHIEEAIPLMRGFPPSQRMSIAHHVDVAQAVSRLLEMASPSHRIYNVVDDEAPELAALFAAVGQPPPDGTSAERASAFDALLDGRRLREDLEFKPVFPRLEDAIKANALDRAWPQ